MQNCLKGKTQWFVKKNFQALKNPTERITFEKTLSLAFEGG